MQKRGGYGIVYQQVLRNPVISIEAKAVYAYLAGYAGISDECFPSIALMCTELGISKSRLYKHMAFLIEAGVVVKKQTYKGNLKSKVVYHITHTVNEEFSVSEKLGNRDLWNPRNAESKNNILTNNNSSSVVELFNSICVSLPKVTKLSEGRKKAIKARFNEGYTIEDFKTLFEKAENSTFLKGANDRNWSATFDWLIKSSNMAKTIDGNYERKQKGCVNVVERTESASSFKL